MCGVVRVGADREWICRVMIGDWQDEWDLNRRGADRSVNRHDTCRVAAYLNKSVPRTCIIPQAADAPRSANETTGKIQSLTGIDDA